MHNEVYADGVSEITVTGPIIRLDLVSMAPSTKEGADASAPVFRMRVIMPVAAFANTVDLMQRALDSMVAAGAVTRERTIVVQDQSDVSLRPVVPEAAVTINRSPNFPG